MQAVVNALIVAMAAGKSVYASDLASLNSSVYNLWRSHTHSATDIQGIDTFGNVTTYGVGGTVLSQTTFATTPAYGAVTTPGGIATDAQITAADINVLIAMINNMRVHSHTITDGVGVTGQTASITAQTYSWSDSAPTSVTLVLANDGQLSYTGGATGAEWNTMAPVDLTTAASYDVYVTVSSGSSVTGSPLGTWLNLGTTRSWTLASGAVDTTITSVLTVQIRSASTLAVLDTASITLQCTEYTYVPPVLTCFPAGSFVLMADGTWKLIEDVDVGDMIMGMGHPEPVISMDRPFLGGRRMKTFQDNSLSWSEEHAMWTRDANQSQWWWSANPVMWKAEAASGEIGGLLDNQSMRGGNQAVDWAHVDGWKTNTVSTGSVIDPNTRLYLPRTNGSPIIVNGYVVGAGVNQAGFDYTTLDWDSVIPQLPVVQPLPVL
jgi:hypothetical protein